MTIIIFSIIAVILVSLIVYFTLVRKTKCPNCFSKDVILTGEKRYKENPPIAAFGLPDSYFEIEYKWSKCGNVFWHPKQAIIFN